MTPLSPRKSARFRWWNPARYAWDRALAGRSAVPVLVVSDDRAFTSEQQFGPLTTWRADLRRRLGLAVNHRWLGDVLGREASALAGYDRVVVKLGFQTAAADAEAIVAALAAAKPAASRLVYFDGDDDAAIQWPGVLRLADRYVKCQAFADPAWYTRPFVGKSNLTDHVAAHHGMDFTADPRPATVPCDADQLHKIALGWNLGLARPMVRLHRASTPPDPDQQRRRGHDLVCRSAIPDGWLEFLRRPALDAINALSARRRVLATAARVSRPQYLAELRDSRICVSPFGFGEVCWRDFEAVLCGCLLVKPDMSHLRTEPDVFVPGQTYVPVRWDFADLADVVDRYLDDDAARQQIVAQAYAAMDRYLTADWVVARVRHVLDLEAETSGPLNLE